jgi:tRNA dimethylallyltransferase
MLQRSMNHRMIVIGGPTASGKSALALAVAHAFDGVIVNADSMQLYRDLPILTARPAKEDQRGVPHLLYGIWPPDIQGSAGQWLELMRALLESRENRPLVVVGGTGLYLDALLNGMAAVPSIDPRIRTEVRAIEHARLYAILTREDPAMAVTLRASDPQRLMRALEVIRSTGRSLLAWQSDPRLRLDLGPIAPLRLALTPPRVELVARIGRRLELMLEAGALEELRAFMDDPASHGSPLMKAVGVTELAAHVAGSTSREDAATAAMVATRQYAKRQVTFLRHRLSQLQPFTAFGDDQDVQEAVIEQVRTYAR